MQVLSVTNGHIFFDGLNMKVRDTLNSQSIGLPDAGWKIVEELFSPVSENIIAKANYAGPSIRTIR